MPFQRHSVGGIEVRRRRPRFPGEPAHARLEFVKSKRINPIDQWDLIRSSYPPTRGMANYNDALMTQFAAQQQQWSGGYQQAGHTRYALGQQDAPNPHAYQQLPANAYNGAKPWSPHDAHQHVPPPPPLHSGQRVFNNYPNQRHLGSPVGYNLARVREDEDEDPMRPMIESRWPGSHSEGHDFRSGSRHRMPQRYDAPMDESDEEDSPMPFRGNHRMSMPRAYDLDEDEEYGYG